MPMFNEFALVTTHDAAKQLGLNPRSVLQAVYRKALSPLFPRATLLFTQAELDRYAATKQKDQPVKSGRVRSGKARMAQLSATDRHELAKKGAAARWGERYAAERRKRKSRS